MRHILMLVLLVLLDAVPAPAMAGPPRNVLCFGDSTTFNFFDGTPGYPAVLQALRPGLAVYNRGQIGDVTSNLPRFQAALAERTWDTVVILLGVNDPRPGIDITDPHQSLLNIWKMATTARSAGAEVILLTPLPTGRLDPTQIARQTYTRDVANELVYKDLDNTHPHITVADLRDEFTVAGWLNFTTDGWHPTLAGQELMGAYVAGLIP